MTAPEYPQKVLAPAPRYKEQCQRPVFAPAEVPCGVPEQDVCVNCALERCDEIYRGIAWGIDYFRKCLLHVDHENKCEWGDVE